MQWNGGLWNFVYYVFLYIQNAIALFVTWVVNCCKVIQLCLINNPVSSIKQLPQSIYCWVPVIELKCCKLIFLCINCSVVLPLLFLLKVKLDEQERLIRELEGALQRAAVEVDRRLTKQQREYEQKMQLLMHQITTSSTAIEDQPVTETTESK